MILRGMNKMEEQFLMVMSGEHSDDGQTASPLKKKMSYHY